MGMVLVGRMNMYSYLDNEGKRIELRSLLLWESESITLKRRVLENEVCKVNTVLVTKNDGVLVEGELSGGVGGTLNANHDLSFVHFVGTRDSRMNPFHEGEDDENHRTSHRSLNQMKEQKVVLSIGGPRLVPFKSRRKFPVRNWPFLKELSPHPSSRSNEEKEESLNQDQVSKESSDDFANNWNDSSDEDSSDVVEIDASKFVPKNKRHEDTEDAHSNV
ncbi:OLC1v1018714C1 [Oldenlandia corymbosa var. corymbosa]|uniref:OLC1v1018714C1 n=1 Tax=Oldenlandia corymbosa var. corymbosa TaxID=529605 RepID=A0AAV1ECM1_OLDCO|nr:OLC1v1018714C1 [Oldenlandia corymbosa var. corymbosa]